MVSALVDSGDRIGRSARLLAGPATALDQCSHCHSRRPVVGTFSGGCAKRLQSQPGAGLNGPQTVMLRGNAASPHRAPLPTAQSDD